MKLRPGPLRVHALVAAIGLVAPALATLATTLRAAPSAAAGTKSAAPKTVVILGDGKGAAALVGGAKKALPAGWAARPPATVAPLGAGKTSLASSLAAPKTHAKTLAEVHRALDAHALDALVVLHVVATKKGRSARVVLIVRDEDAPALDETIALGAQAGPADDAALAAVLADPLERRAPSGGSMTATSASSATTASTEDVGPDPAGSSTGVATETTATATATTTTTTTPPGSDAGATPPPLLTLGVLGELATRRFTYDGTTAGGLRPYNLPNVAVVGVDLELRPLHARHTSFSGLALAADLHQSIGLRSTIVGSSATANASWTRFDGAIRWWLPLDGARASWLAPSVGVGQDRFAFSPSTPDLPSVAYRYVRGGLDLLARLSTHAAVVLDASYLLVTTGGEVSAHFRRATTWGLQVGGGLAVDLSAAIELRVTVDWRRYTAKFGGAQPGDPYLATGAVDEMVRTIAAVRLRY